MSNSTNTNIIDLSVFKKENLTIESMTGEKYIIPGNFSTEFYIYLMGAYERYQKLKKEDYKASMDFMREIALEIIKLDTTKSPTMATIDEQFNDFRAPMALVKGVMDYAVNEANDPLSESPNSK
ncbi:hypothetical protein [Enterococcus sp.]|uniref:hypothetical protein n=1 Tax=Enterococcus sp. TaxID=35783 RepID=UPI00289EE9D0|nr:hypothetical protein [Enterococcus sp.]